MEQKKKLRNVRHLNFLLRTVFGFIINFAPCAHVKTQRKNFANLKIVQLLARANLPRECFSRCDFEAFTTHLRGSDGRRELIYLLSHTCTNSLTAAVYIQRNRCIFHIASMPFCIYFIYLFSRFGNCAEITQRISVFTGYPMFVNLFGIETQILVNFEGVFE